MANTYNPNKSTTHPPDNGFAVLIATLFSIVILPSAVFFTIGTSSMAAGVVISSLSILSMRLLELSGARFLGYFRSELSIALLVIVLLAAHLVVCAFVNDIDLTKSSTSLVIAALMILGCGTAASIIYKSTNSYVWQAVAGLACVFFLSVIFAALRIQPPSTTATSKPVFPFTEPSHYAGAILPILAFFVVKSKGWTKWTWISIGLGIGLILQNLSMIVGMLVVAAICMTLIQGAVFVGLLLAVIPFLDLTYFLDRLQFNVSSTTNLSTLVYLQGWDLIDEAITKTYGWGLGFQQLGFTFLNSPISDLIYKLNGGSDLNLKEGSFTAAKIISELGVFGLIMCFIQFYLTAKSYKELRNISFCRIDVPDSIVLALCSVYTYIVEVIVRGTGYFSGPTMLFVTSLFIIFRNSKSRICLTN